MARKPVRVVLGVVGGLFGLLLLAAVLLPLLVPRDQLRQMAEEQARLATGGEVTLGELSLKVFPRLRLVLGESAVAVTGDGLREAGQIPGPLVTGQASLERLEVDLALLPLLSRRLEFGEVKLVSPRLELATAPVDPEAAAETGQAAATETESSSGDAAGVGLALAAVAVRDGEIVWREEGTGREVTVTGWNQDLQAPALGAVVQRLQRLGGLSLPADDHAGPASLQLETRVQSIALVGFAEQPLPALEDLLLRGRLSVPPSAAEARIDLEQLSLAGLELSGLVRWDAASLSLAELTLTVADAGGLTGQGTVTLDPPTGPVSLGLSGELDLAHVLAAAQPWLPPREAEADPLPDLRGVAAMDLEVELRSQPDLAAGQDWATAWQTGLDGRVQARVTIDELDVTSPQLDAPLKAQQLVAVADLDSPRGRTRLSVARLQHPAVQGQISAELTLPPATGPLQVEARLGADLARVMATAEALMPPRPADAEPLPDLTGAVDVVLDVDLPDAPSLADTLAWQQAWAAGLAGTARLEARGRDLKAAVPALGPEPVTLATLQLSADLRSPRSRSRVEVAGLAHPVMSGAARLDIQPEGDAGVPRLELTLDALDLDAMVAINQALQEARQQHASGWSLVATAWADTTEAPAVGEMIPADLDLDFAADLGRIQLQKLNYREVAASGTLRERVIDVPSLAARLGTGRITGKARVDYAQDPTGHATWEARAQQVPAASLLGPYIGDLAAVWTGTLDATVSGGCGLADPEVIRQSLTLVGDLSGSDGRLDLRQQLGDVAQYLGNRQDLLRVTYDAIQQHVDIRDGKVLMEGLRLDGKDTDWTGDGWIGLDGTIDMGLSVKLPAGYTPSLGSLSFLAEGLRDDDGRVTLDLKLTGQSRKPSVGLDLDPAKMLESQGLQDGLKDEVKKGLGGLLDRLGGK